MQLFFDPSISETSEHISFNKDESRHIVKVLRKKEGDTLYITNGSGWLFISSIIQANIKNCLASIIRKEKKPALANKVHLAVAPTKLNDRYEWFLEKATEIGVTEITPIICSKSERKIIKHERYLKIVQAAMKQSLQCYLPKLNNQISFNDFLLNENEGQNLSPIVMIVKS